MRINNQHLNFKGYDAAPLKRIYVDSMYHHNIYSEISNICKKENIDLVQLYDNGMWSQDDKFIIEKEGKPHLVGDSDIQDSLLEQFKYIYKIQGERVHPFIDGGNAFIGKFPNGKKWAIIGAEKGDSISEKTKTCLAKSYNIKSRNIFDVPKPDFHIDLGIRPIGFPDVLVNDPSLAQQELEKLNDGSKEYETLKKSFDANKYGASYTYASCDEICDNLKMIGFNPIRIAGVFYNGINYMNAIVNKHSDGTLSYITNSSECDNHIYTKLQANFEKELKEKVPNVDKVYFIKGKDDGLYKIRKTNYMVHTIKNLHGGIHCMTLEEPDFSIWA